MRRSARLASIRLPPDDPAALFAAAEATLTNALSLEPNNAMAHAAMRRLLVLNNRETQGVAESERALALNPNLADAHAIIGLAKIASGHAEEAEGHVLEALRISPRDPNAYIWLYRIAAAKLFRGADEEAVGWFHRSIDVNRNAPLSHYYLAANLELLGRHDEAKAEAQAGQALDPEFTIRRYRSGAASDNPDFLKQRERIIEGMRKAGVPEG
jgi:tetratricopeptide (TPR) repeat protein